MIIFELMFQNFQDLSDITDANSLNSLSSKLESLDFVNNPVIVNGGQLKVKLQMYLRVDRFWSRCKAFIFEWLLLPWRDHTHEEISDDIRFDFGLASSQPFQTRTWSWKKSIFLRNSFVHHKYIFLWNWLLYLWTINWLLVSFRDTGVAG